MVEKLYVPAFLPTSQIIHCVNSKLIRSHFPYHSSAFRLLGL